MPKYFFLVLSILLTNVIFSQVRITGKVTDNKNHPLSGVSVSIKNSYDGGITDTLGKFSFKTTEKGEHTLVASSISFNEQEQKITIDNETVVLTFSLREKLDELKAVTVTAGTFEAGDKKRAATVLSTMDILTTGGANADISATVKTLPGAQQVGESEGLFVRGGAGYETKQFIDGTLV